MKNQKKVENSHLYQTAQQYCVCKQTSLPSFMLHNIAMSCLTAPREATKSGRQPRHRPRYCPREKAKDNQLEPSPIPLSRPSKTRGCDISDDRPVLIITGSKKRSQLFITTRCLCPSLAGTQCCGTRRKHDSHTAAAGVRNEMVRSVVHT